MCVGHRFANWTQVNVAGNGLPTAARCDVNAMGFVVGGKDTQSGVIRAGTQIQAAGECVFLLVATPTRRIAVARPKRLALRGRDIVGVQGVAAVADPLTLPQTSEPGD